MHTTARLALDKPSVSLLDEPMSVMSHGFSRVVASNSHGAELLAESALSLTERTPQERVNKAADQDPQERLERAVQDAKSRIRHKEGTNQSATAQEEDLHCFVEHIQNIKKGDPERKEHAAAIVRILRELPVQAVSVKLLRQLVTASGWWQTRQRTSL